MAEESVIEQKFKEEEKEVKFTEEEMSKLKGIRDAYLDIQYKFGQSSMVRLRLEERIQEMNAQVETLKEEYRNNQKKEQDFLDEINNKYGDGTLNPETGIFTPTITQNS